MKPAISGAEYPALSSTARVCSPSAGARSPAAVREADVLVPTITDTIDAALIEGESSLTLSHGKDAEVLVFDLSA